MSEYTTNAAGYALDWDDEIKFTESEYVVLPEGTYPFTVQTFERQNYDGGKKIPPCKMAVLTLSVDGGAMGAATVTERLYLHTSAQWKLSEFFHAIGQLQRDGAVRMNWAAVPGASGMLELGVNTYTNKDGQERTNNRVTHFLAQEKAAGAAPAPAPAPAPGQPAPSAPTWNRGR